LYDSGRKFFEMAVIALEEKKHYAGGKKLDFENHLRFAA
jgi:hypothetical protein